MLHRRNKRDIDKVELKRVIRGGKQNKRTRVRERGHLRTLNPFSVVCWQAKRKKQ